MDFDVQNTCSGPFLVRSVKPLKREKEDMDVELQDLEVIWNREAIDIDIQEEETKEKEENVREQDMEEHFYCVTPDRPQHLTRFERRKVSCFLSEVPSRPGEMCFYQFCVGNVDPKCVDVYKLVQRPPSIKKRLKKTKSRMSRIKKRRKLFKNLFADDFQ